MHVVAPTGPAILPRGEGTCKLEKGGYPLKAKSEKGNVARPQREPRAGPTRPLMPKGDPPQKEETMKESTDETESDREGKTTDGEKRPPRKRRAARIWAFQLTRGQDVLPVGA